MLRWLYCMKMLRKSVQMQSIHTVGIINTVMRSRQEGSW